MNTGRLETKPPRATPSSLADLVGRFQVCWEVWPEYAIVRGEHRQIGFAVVLAGTHERGVAHPVPGCTHCHAVFEALQEIALSVLPCDDRPSVHRVSGYDQAIHFPPSRRHRPEVVLTIRILHRGDVERPVDECEVRCLAEIKDRLRALGASEGQWTRGKPEGA